MAEDKNTLSGQLPMLPNNESPFHAQQPPAHHQQSPTKTDRLFDELKQVLDEEPGVATEPNPIPEHLQWSYGPSRIPGRQEPIHFPHNPRRTARPTRSDYETNTIMVGKKSGRALLREEGKWLYNCLYWETTNSVAPGLEKTDNEMDLTSWPQVQMINQKNYYT